MSIVKETSLSKHPKKIRDMFDQISPTYDTLNRLLSIGIDQSWRNTVVKNIPSTSPISLLDMATGTGDLFLMALKKNTSISKVVGIDLSQKMLDICQQKISQASFDAEITLAQEDASHTSFQDQSFDIITMAFGIRNTESPDTVLKEMYRLLRPGGRTLILEFSLPRSFIMRQLYLFYFRYWVPFIGQLLSGNREAYTYLNRSVENWSKSTECCRSLSEAGFSNVQAQSFTFGIATLYIGIKE